MLLTDVFESGQFKEYRDNDLIKLYRKYFDNVRLLKGKFNTRLRSFKKQMGEDVFFPEWLEFDHELKKTQDKFIDQIRNSVKSNNYIFISHKHSDLTNTLDIICFLSMKYHIGAYVDCFDYRQPLKTSIATAIRIKEVIQQSHRFLFMATNGAIASKWCNWELGYGDSLMHSRKHKHLAFWALQNTAIKQGNFKGNEYMEMYPFIVYRLNSSDSDSNGYSVRIRENGYDTYIPLDEWLK